MPAYAVGLVLALLNEATGYQSANRAVDRARREVEPLLLRLVGDPEVIIIAAAPSSLGFARSVSKTSLQCFHSIIMGRNQIASRWAVQVVLISDGLSHTESIAYVKP